MFPELEELEVEAEVEEVPWVLIKAACLRHQQLKQKKPPKKTTTTTTREKDQFKGPHCQISDERTALSMNSSTVLTQIWTEVSRQSYNRGLVGDGV